MRIIGGKYRGLKLLPPDGFNIRPTSDRLKESLFSIISSNKYKIKIDNCNVLDICSGTGSLGIEAFSRGALSVYLLDSMLNFPISRPISHIYFLFILVAYQNLSNQHENNF